MAEPYRGFGSFILFKEILADELGHVYRAAEVDRSAIRRHVWLRLFDAPGIPAAEVGAQADTANRVGTVLQSANVGVNPRLVVEGGVPALAVDFIPGQPLSLVLRKVRAEGFPVPVDNCLLILEKISLGLSAALAVEVGGSPLVHGFLHPGLVLVTHDGEGLVTGFGAADQLLALLDTPASAEKIRPYLAPEVLLSRTTTRRGDVYSLGAILFELLTGEPLPGQPEQRAAALDRAELAYDEQPLPQDIKTLLQRALSPRPEDRFSSAADFKRELDKLLYGGAYSPTTFNLALFMDRLFRSEIEAEERECAVEARVDVTSYSRPEPPPAPEAVPVETRARSRGLGLWIAIAAGIAVVGITAVLLLGGGGPSAVAAPTPTAAEQEAQRAADQARLKEMVERELGRLMAEKEKEILAELSDRQGKIDELQKRLKDMQQQSSTTGGTETAEAKRSREELERQLAAEKAAKEQRENSLEEERQRALEEARRKAAVAAATAQPPPTAVAAVSSPALETPAEAAAQPPPPKTEPTQVARSEPSLPPSGSVTVTQNMFLDPTQADTLPAALKEAAVTWSRAALYSRRRGVIILQATVNADGRVEEVKVLRADHDGFGIPEAATEAVQKYLFKPGTKDGLNIKTYATVTIPYRFQTR